jgi:hypothetical protein
MRPAESNGCVRSKMRYASLAAVQWPGPRAQGCTARAEGQLAGECADLHHHLTAVLSGTSIVYFDDFYGKDWGQAGGSPS